MRTPSVAELLDVWENGSGQALIHRALALLAASCPEDSWDALAALSVGRRDERLLDLRESLFGRRLTGIVVCPGCGKRLELELDLEEMRSSFGKTESEVSLHSGGYDLRFRLPNSNDLEMALGQGDVAAGRRLLLDRCALSVSRCRSPVKADELPAEVVEVVAQRMAEADPMAEIRIVTSCPFCNHQWRAALDIVTFLWGELEAWASRILNDVHVLASAYGWREQDILALSPLRRQRYLDMVGA